jgi:hypothetical protein
MLKLFMPIPSLSDVPAHATAVLIAVCVFAEGASACHTARIWTVKKMKANGVVLGRMGLSFPLGGGIVISCPVTVS